MDDIYNVVDLIHARDDMEVVEERDYIDTHRADSPLVIADDAIEIDNSELNKAEQFTIVLDLVNEVIKAI